VEGSATVRRQRSVSYFVPVVLLLPLAALAALVGICERLLGDDGTLARLLSRPFTWAVERDGRVKKKVPPARIPEHIIRTRVV